MNLTLRMDNDSDSDDTPNNEDISTFLLLPDNDDTIENEININTLLLNKESQPVTVIYKSESESEPELVEVDLDDDSPPSSDSQLWLHISIQYFVGLLLISYVIIMNAYIPSLNTSDDEFLVVIFIFYMCLFVTARAIATWKFIQWYRQKISSSDFLKLKIYYALNLILEELVSATIITVRTVTYGRDVWTTVQSLFIYAHISWLIICFLKLDFYIFIFPKSE